MVEISWFGRTSLHASCILNTRSSIVDDDDHLYVVTVVIVKLGRQVQRKLAVVVVVGGESHASKQFSDVFTMGNKLLPSSLYSFSVEKE